MCGQSREGRQCVGVRGRIGLADEFLTNFLFENFFFEKKILHRKEHYEIFSLRQQISCEDSPDRATNVNALSLRWQREAPMSGLLNCCSKHTDRRWYLPTPIRKNEGSNLTIGR